MEQAGCVRMSVALLQGTAMGSSSLALWRLDTRTSSHWCLFMGIPSLEDMHIFKILWSR